MKRRYLRTLAVALIILPEPFTTPFGLLLLAVSFILPKRHKDNLRNMEALVRRYLNTSEPSGFNNVSLGRETPVFNQDNGNSNASHHVTTLHDYIDKKSRAEFQYYYANDSHKVSDIAVRHVMLTGVPQYKTVPIKSDKVLHHSLKTTLQPSISDVFYTKLQPIISGTPAKVVYHSIKRC